MKSKTPFLTMACLFTLAWAASGTTYFRGELNGWGTTALNADSDFGAGNYYAATITAASNDSSSELKFDTGSWSFSWGAGTSAGKNASIGAADHSGSGNLSFANASNTYRYTFRLKDPESYWQRSYAVMETAGDPVTISNVVDGHLQDPSAADIPITIQLAASKSPQESIWIRYSTDGWSSSKLTASAAGSSTNYSASIPLQSAGTRLQYYVLTSTMPSNQITSDFDLCTLHGKKSGSTNFGFRIGAANAWHIPTNAEPSAAFMRNPPTNGVNTNQAVYLYNGNQYAGSGNTGDQASLTICHRLKGATSWTATNGWYDSVSGNNKYWAGAIPAGAYGATNVVEYYLKLTFNDHNTTFIGTTNSGAGAQTFLLETNAQAAPFSFVYGAAAANLGNCWHIPTNVEPYTATMRNPATVIATNQDVYIYNGNQFQGSGNIGDQSGGTLYYRRVGAGSWSSTNLSYDNQDGNNKYWKSMIPAGTYGATNVIEYYLSVTYNDHDTTCLGTTNNGTTSLPYASAAEAQAHPFTFTYSAAAGQAAAWMWHNDNRVNVGSNVQCWVKIGYAEGIGSNRWVDYAAIYYTTNGTAPGGRYGAATNASTFVQAMAFDHMEEDSYPSADSMWWVGMLTNLPMYTTIRYRIGSWKTTNDLEQFADYNTSGTNNNIFSFSLGTTGAMALTVGGQNADYTTTKFFIDEIAHETQTLVAAFTPGVPNLAKVEVFCNLDRRDYCDVDYTNAYIAGDGYADGIRPPDGNLISTNDTGAYFRAYPMTAVGGGQYVWTGSVSKCGAYRLTARYATNGAALNTWTWYTSDGRRDHAIVVSPTKIRKLTMYELNARIIKATDNTEAGRSTFGSLSQGSDSFTNFNLHYLDRLQANCLWFQPIHPNAQERKDSYTPGSPYATRNYFAVSPYFSAAETEDAAMNEFTNFVIQCDGNTGAVGTVNVMLDGVFNHTAWDAVFGEPGVTFGFCTNANDRIGWFRPTWYSLITDYGLPATYYHGSYDNDFATAPDRGDFGKWPDVTELYYGKYSALVRHNPENNGDYLNEGDTYDFAGMTNTNEMDLWKYMAYYTEFWLKKTGHAGSNTWVLAQDDKGIDGLRCDFGQGLPPQIWEYIINRTRHMKWNFVFMAETLDGGRPGYRSNRHFDVLNENLVFKFTQEHINDSWALRQALEDRRTMYNGGAVLLNLTSHDEVLPDNDTWLNASRYGAVSIADGIPMIFYGQEQGLQNWQGSVTANTGFKTPHEENFGKFIPNFQQWNKLTVWDSPPDNSVGLAQWYGRVNWARLNSAALRSPNRYFLSKVGGGDEARILAAAKYETAYASPRASDVVLAFALLFRHGEAHTGASATYDLQPVWSLLGLNTGKLYTVRNLASSQPLTPLASGWPRTGQDLYDNGLWVNLQGGTSGSITNDGELVQYLKLEEVNQAPIINLPGPHTLPVGAATNFPVSAYDPDGDPVSLTNATAPVGATFSAGTFSWTAGATNENTSNTVAFVADDGRSATNSVVTNQTYILVPFDWNTNGIGDGWEWVNFNNLTNSAVGDNDGDRSSDFDEYVAGTQPTNPSSVFSVRTIAATAGSSNHLVTVATEPARQYTIYFGDGGMTNDMTWSPFGNTNNGFGTWIETSTVSATHAFVDDEGTNTTSETPAADHRFYRVKVRK